MSNSSLPESLDPANVSHWSLIAELTELAGRMKTHPIPENPVIFYGSSSFRLWDPTIRQDLDSDRIINLAFGGSTLTSCRVFFNDIMSPYRTAKSMVIYAGDNDLGEGKSALAIHSEFLGILAKVEERFGQIPVFFVSIKPSPSKQSIIDRIIESNRLIQQESAARDNLHYVDIFTPMLTPSGESNPAYFEEDMLHMNQAGYQVWKSVILERRQEIGF